MPKDYRVRGIDVPPALNVGAETTATAESLAPPAIPTPPAPTGLVLTTGLVQSDRSARAYINATWLAPSGLDPNRYLVQIATNSAFTANMAIYPVDAPDPGLNPSAYLSGLKPNTTYYVRVACKYYEAVSPWTAAESITTAQDTTPPGPVTSAAATWSANGDLRITWTNPGDENFWRVEVELRKDNAAGAIILTDYSSRGSFVLSQEQNRQLAGLHPVVYVRLRTQSYSGAINTASPVTLTTTKMKPGTPAGISHNWSGDTGTAPADWVISWSVTSGANRYRLTVDSVVVYEGSDTRFVYGFAKNRTDHSGTPDHDLTYSLVALDGLDQASTTPATGTATNAAPPAISPASNIALDGSFALNAVLTYTEPADFSHYTFRIVKDGSTLTTHTGRSKTQSYNVTTRGSYQVGVTVTDLFGRSSSETLSAAQTIDFLTVDDLRRTIRYRDSISTSPTTLNALKDTDLSTTVVSYTGDNTWRWTEAIRELLDVYWKLTLALDTGVSWYLASSNDGGTSWRWYAGPLTGATLSEVASESAAQTAAISSTTLGSGANVKPILPSYVEARVWRLYHRKSSGTYGLKEYYPRRLVESDDIRAETLAAISADLGTITAGTVTGATVQTATSGPRTVMSAAANGGLIGYNGTDTYNPASGGGTYQVFWSKLDGKLRLANGAVIGDASGWSIIGGTGWDMLRLYKFIKSDGTLLSGMGGYDDGFYNTILIGTESLAGRGSEVKLQTTAPSGQPQKITLEPGGWNSRLILSKDSGFIFGDDLNGTGSRVTMYGPLRFGGSSFPANPQTGDLWFRTDRLLWYYYDGFRWLTEQVFSTQLTFFADATVTYSATTAVVRLGIMSTQYIPFVTRIELRPIVNTTNDASNYWTMSIQHGTATVATQSTSGGTVGALAYTIASGFTQPASTAQYFAMDITKVGSPGTFNPRTATVYYRLVG